MFITSRPFVTWLILVAITFSGLAWAYVNGVVWDAIEHDKFHVVSIIFVWFVVATAVAGCVCYNVEKKIADGPSTERMNSFLWFSAGNLLNLGLVGTVYGFIAMLDSAFVGKSFTDPSAIPALLPIIGENWATALYATAAGITLNVALAVQAFVAASSYDKFKFLSYEEDAEGYEQDLMEKFGVTIRRD